MPSVEQTLAAYAPVLRYHSDELYGAVAVEALADFFFDGGPGAPRGTSSAARDAMRRSPQRARTRTSG